MDHHDEPQDNRDDAHQNTPTNDNHDEQQQPNVRTETYIFSGNGGAAFLATVQNIFTRIVSGQIQLQRPPQMQLQQPAVQQSGPSVEDTAMRSEHHDDMPPLVAVTDLSSTSESASSSSIPLNASANNSSSSSNTNPPHPPGWRPVRPLPRAHAHAHIHTPNGVIDLFTLNLSDLPAPGGPGTANFTFNMGQDVFAGFENIFLHPKEPEPDFDRAKTLLRGMEVVPEGLVKRLERTGGVPGGQGAEEHAGCAVCYGRLLEDVEPGEWDNAQQKEAKEKAKDDDAMKTEEDEFHGRIVALPCAHVYHAECLLPWFARNTTCPTCRFDIDPDSLTWKPRPLPPRPERNANSNMEDTNVNTGPPEATAEPFRLPTVAEAIRFNAFFESLDRMPGHRATAANGQPQPEAHSAEATPSSPPQSAPEFPDPSQPRSQEPFMYGPAPPPPPPPHVHAIPAIFRMPMPLFIIPNSQARLNQQRQRQQQQTGQPQPRPQQEAQRQQASQPVPLHPQRQQASQPVPFHPQRQQASQPVPFHPQRQQASQPVPLHPQRQQASQPVPLHPQRQQASQPVSFLPQPQAYPQHLQWPPRFRALEAFTPPRFPAPEAFTPPRFPAPEAFTPIPFPFPIPIPVPEHGAFHRAFNIPRDPSQPRRKWLAPDPVGKTLRQRVETKERELGLRCDDPVCGLAPEDDDVGESHHEGLKRVKLRAAYNAQLKACEHQFHPECLVRSARVSGTRDSRPISLEEGTGAEEDVLVQCSVCRAEGWLWKEEWAEGSCTDCSP